MANYWLFIKHRIPNVIYSEPPMPRWKMWTLKAAVWMLAIVVPGVIFILTRRFGDFNVFWVSISCLVLAIFAAIWWERRKRPPKRQLKVVERA